MYILSFKLKEQLSLLLQNVCEVKQSTPALRIVFTMCASTRQNGLLTVIAPPPRVFIGGLDLFEASIKNPFCIKEQLMVMLQNVNDVNKRAHPHCSGV